MPKKVRKMTFLQLCSEFDGSSNAVIEQENRNIMNKFMAGISSRGDPKKKRSKATKAGEPQTVLRSKNNFALKTPSGKGRPFSQCTENVREPKSGEAILSVNGSPLGTVASNRVRSRMPQTQTILRTVKKRGVPGVAIAVEGVDVADIVTTAGKEVLSSEEKKDARKQIMDLQDQLASLMQQLA